MFSDPVVAFASCAVGLTSRSTQVLRTLRAHCSVQDAEPNIGISASGPKPSASAISDILLYYTFC